MSNIEIDEILDYIKDDLLNLFSYKDEEEVAEYKSECTIDIIRYLMKKKIKYPTSELQMDTPLVYHFDYRKWFDENYETNR